MSISMKFFRHFFLNNIGLKIISVLLAFLLWVQVASREPVQRTVMLPVELVNMPLQMEILNDYVKTIEVDIRSEFGTSAFDRQELAVVIDLSDSVPGTEVILLSDQNLSMVDAFFESMSGITTTGSTIITNLNDAPKGILIWRSILQWLGGIGVIVMAVSILPLLNVGGMQLFKQDQASDSTEKILPKAREVTFVISSIYLTLTFVCGSAYWFTGMNVFDSIAHSMTTIATGGFSTYSESIGYFPVSYTHLTLPTSDLV